MKKHSDKKKPTMPITRRKRKWTDKQWEKVLAKPYEEWTDDELEEEDRRTAERVANMEWFDVAGARYIAIESLLNPSDQWIADDFKRNDIRGFFQHQTLADDLFILQGLIDRSQDVHRRFQQRLLFSELLSQKAIDNSVSGVQYNIDKGTISGVKGPYLFRGEIDWSETHFICQVSGSRRQLRPDFILIMPIPNLLPLGSSFN